MMKDKFVDVHSHLDICKNIPKIIEDCRKKEIEIVTCGIDEKSNRKTLKLKEKYPEIKICLGIYPLDSLKLSEEEIEEETEFIKKNKDDIIGIGEVGLDLHSVKDSQNFEKQKRVLEKFAKLAKELGKPIFVHSRDAEKETIELLEDLDYRKIVMHCFSGNMKLVDRVVKNGWMLSIPASVKYNQHFQKIAEIVPIENLLCETDSPFLHPDRKQDNSSVNVIESYKKIAEIKGINLEETKNRIFKNYSELRKA